MTVVMECRFRRPGFELHVDLEIRTGELAMVRGPNGSGKSTLLHLVAGLLAVEHGRIELNGRTVDSTDWHGRDVFVQPEDRHTGFLPQGGALFPHMTVMDNVGFGLRSRGEPSAEVSRRALGMLATLGVGDFASRRPHQLSGGQRQRVALARTLVMSPGVLLLDEPTTALDEAGRSEVVEILTRVKETFGGPIVMVSHDGRDADALADRVIDVDVSGGPDARSSRIG